ncbi:30S ribosomal protein S15 [Hirschfeldia incana]|nr:30S ribosomal protein S15 [Hirschfeldia incana]
MASLLARRQRRFQSNPSLTRFFSNSSSPDPPPQSAEKPSQTPPSSQPPSSYSSPFADIKSTLKQKIQQDQERNPFSRSSDTQGPSTFSDHKSRGSLQDLGINLAKFQRRSTPPPPRDSSSQSRPHVSFEALYKQNVVADPRNRKEEDTDSSSLWESLKTLKPKSNALSNNAEMKGMSFRSFKNTLKGNVGRGEPLPASVFGEEMDVRKGGEGGTEEMMTEFLKIYREDELGDKLRRLRPEGKKEEGWFSLEELNERLVKLRQVEEKEVYNQRGNVSVFRNVIGTFRNEAAINEAISQQNQDIMGYLDGTPEYKHYPPKDDLVDTYFHTDNLSSAEKMKIELTKVREDFKMSESDCGSARVQVAQLTTKIKHLSSALHKKDKHSRKGLFAMVQKRKKLLKYLRRTDWDSYCLVLSKLSLRDNPDYKF